MNSFEGSSQAGGSSSSWPTEADPSGAAGPADFAEFVNGGFTTFSKSNLTTKSSVTDSQFWLNAGISSSVLSNGVSNPRIVFDPNSIRWFATEITGDAQNNKILLAVSTGSAAGPAPGNWTALSIDNNSSTNVSNGGYQHVDFPTLAVDAGALYITTINQTSTGADDNSTSIFSIPKSSLTAAGGPKLTNATMMYGSSGNADTIGFVPQPAMNLGSSAATPALYAVDTQSFGQINRTNILGSTTANASLSSTSNISVANTQYPIMARQPDGSGGASASSGLEPLDDRIASTVYQVGNLVYLIHTIGIPTEPSATRSAVRWTLLRVNGSDTTVVQEGTITDANHDYFTPSICANAKGDVVIAYERSGPSAVDGQINAFVLAGSTASDGTISFGFPQEVSDSSISSFGGNNGVVPWGLYSSLSPDPLNSDAFWAVQEVPASDTAWTTQVTEIVVPEPSMGHGITMSLFLLIAQRRIVSKKRDIGERA